MTAVLAAADPVAEALSGLASALRAPVHVAALVCLGVLAFELGRLAAEAWRRIRPASRPLEELTLDALGAPEAASTVARLTPSPLTERALVSLAAAGTSPDAVERALADYELQIQRRLDRTRMLVRAGPAIGLMGTLIPLAPGLTALGDGDFEQLAGDLKTAFAATVVGILVGTAAFALTLVRTRLYTEDLAGLERAVARTAAGGRS